MTEYTETCLIFSENDTGRITRPKGKTGELPRQDSMNLPRSCRREMPSLVSEREM